MKRILTTVAALAALSFLAGPTFAQTGNVRLSWGTCDPVVQNLDFTGPGQIATMVLSALGTGSPHKGYRFKVLVSSGLPDAWRFDADGCNVGQLSLNTAGLSKACPAFQGTNPLPIFNYGYEVDGAGTATYDVLNAYNEVLAPNAGTRYTVFQGLFNHAFSNTGPRDPALECGNAEQPICFALVHTEFLNPDLTIIPFGVENDFLTWQDAGNSTGCPGATQNEATTWGRVKGLYR